MTRDTLCGRPGVLPGDMARSTIKPLHSWSGDEVARLIFIVARDLPQLHDYLRHRFATIEDVRVILDRRRRERRAQVGAPAEDRRSSDRRREPKIDEELRSRGFAITHPREAEARD